MDLPELGIFREAAARCREKSLSSTHRENWVRLAEGWERLANRRDDLTKLLRRDDGKSSSNMKPA
jgi:hypothetical protein